MTTTSCESPWAIARPRVALSHELRKTHSSSGRRGGPAPETDTVDRILAGMVPDSAGERWEGRCVGRLWLETAALPEGSDGRVDGWMAVGEREAGLMGCGAVALARMATKCWLRSSRLEESMRPSAW